MTEQIIKYGVQRRAFPLQQEIFGLLTVAVVGAIGYFAFPDDLAFLTRLISITFLVLSLDLVTGYAVGNACIAGITNPLILLAIGAFTGSLMGLISGALITRFHGLPQLVLSIAIGQLVSSLANKLSSLTGGSDGLSGITPAPIFGVFSFDMYSRTSYIFSLVTLAVVMVLLLRFVRSPFGLLCRGIKDDSLRALMIGASAYPRLVVMYGVSGIVAGLGGALMAINTGVVGLDSVSFERSAEVLVMLVLGGAGNLWGALAGAVIFQIFEHIVSAANPFHWMTLVGLLLIIIVIFAPRGLGHSIASLWASFSQRRSRS